MVADRLPERVEILGRCLGEPESERQAEDLTPIDVAVVVVAPQGLPQGVPDRRAMLSIRISIEHRDERCEIAVPHAHGFLSVAGVDRCQLVDDIVSERPPVVRLCRLVEPVALGQGIGDLTTPTKAA